MTRPLLRNRGWSRTPAPPKRAARGRRRCADDSGAGLLELALILPFLAVVIFGTIDLGRAFSLRNRLTNMAREGAFYAQFHPSDVTGCSPTSITTVASLEDTGITNATVTVTDASTGTAITNNCGAKPVGGTRINVKVSAPMAIYTPLIGSIIGNTVSVGSSTEVMVQG